MQPIFKLPINEAIWIGPAAQLFSIPTRTHPS